MRRRDFFNVAAVAGLSGYVSDLAAEAQPGGAITDVAGVKVGHSTRTDRPTGCTVLITEDGATAGVDQRGGAPGTRETDLLNPVNVVDRINAIILSGGSAYGLATADGVMRWLEEHDMGYRFGPGRVVPIVPAAILIDLSYGGSWKIRPTAENGFEACKAASTNAPEQGSVGVGAGATVGKLSGMGRAMKGGFGTASLTLPNGIVIGAMVATNSVGDIWNHMTGKLVAGARTADGKHLADIMAIMRAGKLGVPEPVKSQNTAIGCVATNVALSKPQVTKVAQMATDGYALSIRPVHTQSDGDTIFSVATGKLKIAQSETDRLLSMIGALAADVMARAIVSSVMHAAGTPECPAVMELFPA